MDGKERYTAADCNQTGYDFPLHNKVIVLSRQALPENYPNQLFFCTGGNGANMNPIGRSVFLTSLSDGEQHRFQRSDVVGTLKPELLPDSAKLQLSQIRPSGAKKLSDHEPQYSGYSFLPDGRYAAGVWLCDPQEVMDYVEMQKPYQHRVMICDRDDFAVLEICEGQLIYPSPEDLEAFRQGDQEQDGGLRMT